MASLVRDLSTRELNRGFGWMTLSGGQTPKLGDNAPSIQSAKGNGQLKYPMCWVWVWKRMETMRSQLHGRLHGRVLRANQRPLFDGLLVDSFVVSYS
jgi:hypothetical protein